MVKPICVPCGLFFRPKRNGQMVEEGKPYLNEDQPVRYEDVDQDGNPVPWTGYKLWMGDRWECRNCMAQIVVGIVGPPLREHFEKDYEEQRARQHDLIFVHDC